MKKRFSDIKRQTDQTEKTINYQQDHIAITLSSNLLALSRSLGKCYQLLILLCQTRKLTKIHTNSGITAYKTPHKPFQVLQADIFGPVPTTDQENSYVLTTCDMFSKFICAVPLPKNDAISVAHGLFQLFTTYGVCDTLLTD